MSQRLLKCTICSGDHSIFHCINKCGVCSGDNRQCSCPAQPPQKRRGRPSRAINSLKISRATKGLKKVRHFGERPREGGPVLPKPTTAESREDSCCRSNSMIDFTIKAVSPNTQTTPLEPLIKISHNNVN